MAGYSFETMSASDAAAFTANDYLFFISNGATANQVTVAPYGNGSSGSLTGSGISLTFGGKTLTFNNNISAASETGHVLFNDNSHLIIGTDAADTGAGTNGVGGAIGPVGNTNAAGVHVDPQTVYALGGADTIDLTANGGVAAKTAAYLNGGFGADSINAGNASAHIYGNSITTQTGATDNNGQSDLGDTIIAGAGTSSNYINGNAGNDIITVGVTNTAATGATSNASTGYNRVFGGADNDTITVQGAGHSSVNGNTGNDTITAGSTAATGGTDNSSTGDNTLRGGQGDDSIVGGRGHDVLMGDVGNDKLVVHGETTAAVAGTPSNTHITVLTGGAGADTFDFSAAGAGIASTFSGQVGNSQGANATGQTYYQEITDFTVGEDHIHLANTPSGQVTQVGTSTTIFSNIHDAEVYAQNQLSQTNTGAGGSGTTSTFLVSSLSVGTADNTYLFYKDANAGDPTSGNTNAAGLGIIHLDHVTSTSITNASFQ